MQPRDRGGWKDLLHDVSHYCRNRLADREGERRGHSAKHAYLERDLTAYAINSGWLAGKLKRPEKPKPTPAERVRQRAERIAGRLADAERRRRLLERRIARLRRKVAYYRKKAVLPA